MVIKEITFSVGRTIQIQQYEPINIHYSAKAEVAEGEDVMKAYDQLAHIVNKRIGAEEVKWKDPMKAAKALAEFGKKELARQIKSKQAEVPFK